MLQKQLDKALADFIPQTQGITLNNVFINRLQQLVYSLTQGITLINVFINRLQQLVYTLTQGITLNNVFINRLQQLVLWHFVDFN